MGSFSPLNYSSLGGGGVNYVGQPTATNSWGGTNLQPVMIGDFDLEGLAFNPATDKRHKLCVINKLDKFLGVYISGVEIAEPSVDTFTYLVPPDTYAELDACERYATFRVLNDDAASLATVYSGFLRLQAVSMRFSPLSPV